jgi:hypothetical protein
MIGRCGLCRQHNKDLIRSHFVPAAIYRFLRAPAADPNPIVVKKEISLGTSQQIVDYLLCADCERRFQAQGEDWVLRHCWQAPDNFRLHSMLAGSAAGVLTSPQMKLFAADRIPCIDCSALIYFAASVFWRASAHQWHFGRHRVKRSPLGPKYEEEFRQFLVGTRAFPTKTTLWVSVLESPNSIIAAATLFPWAERKDGYHLHKFVIPGMGFDLFVGNQVPEQMRQMSITANPNRIIIMSSLFEAGVEYNMGRLVAKSHPSKRLQRI